MNFVDRLRFAVHQLHRDHIPCDISDADGNYLVLELRGSALRIASQDKAWMLACENVCPIPRKFSVINLLYFPILLQKPGQPIEMLEAANYKQILRFSSMLSNPLKHELFSVAVPLLFLLVTVEPGRVAFWYAHLLFVSVSCVDVRGRNFVLICEASSTRFPYASRLFTNKFDFLLFDDVFKQSGKMVSLLLLLRAIGSGPRVAWLNLNAVIASHNVNHHGAAPILSHEGGLAVAGERPTFVKMPTEGIKAWYYEILEQNDEVLEASEPVYATQFEAQYAAYQRTKEKPSLFGPVPTTGGKVEGGLRSVASISANIRAKQKDD